MWKWMFLDSKPFFFLWQIFASVPPKKLPYNTPDHIKKILAIDLAKIFVIEDKVRHTLDTIGDWLTTKGSSSHSQFGYLWMEINYHHHFTYVPLPSLAKSSSWKN